ncbi:MAG: hypothetical protein V7603_3097 [Micromonosporaceae bacterium]
MRLAHAGAGRHPRVNRRTDVSVDEVYLLIRALSQASGTKATRRKALAVVLDGLATPAAGR